MCQGFILRIALGIIVGVWFFSLLDPAPVTFRMLVSCSQLLSAHLDGDRVDDLIV